MRISEDYIVAIQAYGYTEIEARFLYIVATHSGYFVPRQFVAFSGAKWGKRSTHFAEKIERRGHAAWREYPGSGGVYHLFAKRLYGDIGKENIRNRRKHAPEFIRTRLLLLDFILSNQHYEFLETEQDKVEYFCERLQVPKTSLPSKEFVGSTRKESTLRYFIDKYPLFFGPGTASLPPVVTLSYVDPGHASTAAFANHLRSYLALFRCLRAFRFLYIANSRAYFDRAARLFSSTVKGPLQTGASAEVLRYFRLLNEWERKQYAALSSDDVEWLSEAKRRFQREPFNTLYREWKAGALGDLTLRMGLREVEPERNIEFETYLVNPKPNQAETNAAVSEVRP